MTKPATASDVATRLHSGAIRLLRWLRREDLDAPLSAAQLSALSVIIHKGPITASELATEEQVSGATMTRTVDALCTAGWARRSRPAADRRCVVIAATAQGETVLAKAAEQRVARLSQRLAALSPEQLASLDQAARIMQELPGREDD